MSCFIQNPQEYYVLDLSANLKFILLAYRDAKEMLEEERQCRAQLEWQLLSSIKVFASFISKHLYSHSRYLVHWHFWPNGY